MDVSEIAVGFLPSRFLRSRHCTRRLCGEQKAKSRMEVRTFTEWENLWRIFQNGLQFRRREKLFHRSWAIDEGVVFSSFPSPSTRKGTNPQFLHKAARLRS